MGTAQERYRRTLGLTSPRKKGRGYNPGAEGDDFAPTPIDVIVTNATNNPIKFKPKIPTVDDVYDKLAELGNTYDKIGRYLDDEQSREAYAFMVSAEKLREHVEGLVKVVEADNVSQTLMEQEMKSLYSQRKNLLARMKVQVSK